MHKVKIAFHKIDVSKHSWCNEATLISIEGGLGSLKKTYYGIYERESYSSQIFSAITLNGKQLVQSKVHSCGSCGGMLATGYGIDENDKEIKEIRDISEAINSEFESLEKSVEDMKPLLGLLEDGLYVIADIPLYPTDGFGNFFWAVPNEEADAGVIEWHGWTDTYASPKFLYPSQSTDLFDPARVDHYIKNVSKKSAPRAVAYKLDGFMCVLLDGHHKATASALSSVPVNCITIIPLDGVGRKNDILYFGRIEVDKKDLPEEMQHLAKNKSLQLKNLPTDETFEGTIIKKKWEQKYLESGKNFPSVESLLTQSRIHR